MSFIRTELLRTEVIILKTNTTIHTENILLQIVFCENRNITKKSRKKCIQITNDILTDTRTNDILTDININFITICFSYFFFNLQA